MAEPMGFFTDTTVCIGCKACEVACHEWNQTQAWNGGQNTLSGDSYDNTRRLDGSHWRHVKFVEQFDTKTPDRAGGGRWLLMSDVCKHCVEAACLDVCPTGAIIRTEFDTVVIQSDVCGLPARPTLSTVRNVPCWLFSAGSAVVAGFLGLLTFRKHRMDAFARQ